LLEQTPVYLYCRQQSLERVCKLRVHICCVTYIALHIVCHILPGDAAKSEPVVVGLLQGMNLKRAQLLRCGVSGCRNRPRLLFLLIKCLVQWHQALLQGIDCGLHPIGKVQFGEDIRDMHFHGPLADHKSCRDLLV
jgi:hypothetical protein